MPKSLTIATSLALSFTASFAAAQEASGIAPDPTAPAAIAFDLPHDLSPWGMFMAADIVVKAVMIGLAFASLVTWTIWLAKSLELGAARMRSGRDMTVIVQSRSMRDAEAAIAEVARAMATPA